MPRVIECPITEAQCADPNCSVSRCREQERDLQAALDQKAESRSRAWAHEVAQQEASIDRRKAAIRAILEILAEANVERAANAEYPLVMPFGRGSREPGCIHGAAGKGSTASSQRA